MTEFEWGLMTGVFVASAVWAGLTVLRLRYGDKGAADGDV